MRIPAWTRNRWVIVPGLLALLVGGWNIYVALNATGRIEGRVVDARGAPVDGARVTLFNRSFITNEPRDRAVTGPDGSFRFSGNASHALQIEADAPGIGRSARRTLRLWFRAQDTVLHEPLVLAPS